VLGGEESARSLRALVANLDGLRIFDVNADHHQQGMPPG
jgi:hypothetical protein